MLEDCYWGAHLFEEPGMLEKVARLAADWFQRHLIADVTA